MLKEYEDLFPCSITQPTITTTIPPATSFSSTIIVLDVSQPSTDLVVPIDEEQPPSPQTTSDELSHLTKATLSNHPNSPIIAD